MPRVKKKQERAPTGSYDNRPGRMPIGRKRGMNPPLFAQDPAGYASGPAQLQAGPRVKTKPEHPIRFAFLCELCCSVVKVF